jgi:NAD(P)-dependent dehydrogenase (short-subunit alcohol dehydrogenase family)
MPLVVSNTNRRFTMTTTKKIALVTGATRGIGLETVRQLAQQDVHVILAGRDAAKANAAAELLRKQKLDVDSITLDVSDEKSIAAAAQQIEHKHGRLDILVNNAGIMIDDMQKTPSQQPLANWRKTFDTNVFGLIAVTQAFLPLLKKSAAGRIVNVSSLLGSITHHADPSSLIYDFKAPVSYNVSKSTMNAWTVQLAHELRNTSIKVNTIHPGHVKTELGGDNAPMEISDGAKTSVALALIGANGPNGSFSHQGQPLPW